MTKAKPHTPAPVDTAKGGEDHPSRPPEQDRGEERRILQNALEQFDIHGFTTNVRIIEMLTPILEAAKRELQSHRAIPSPGREEVQRELDDVKSAATALAEYYESAKADAAFLRGVLQELSPRLIGDGEQDLKEIVDVALSKHPTDAGAGREEVIASSNCPICGVDSPHAHLRECVRVWVDAQASRFGYRARLIKDPNTAIQQSAMKQIEDMQKRHRAAFGYDDNELIELENLVAAVFDASSSAPEIDAAAKRIWRVYRSQTVVLDQVSDAEADAEWETYGEEWRIQFRELAAAAFNGGT